MAEVFGIDLGTTNSCIAEIDPISKLPVVIRNSNDLQTMPSVVWYDEYDEPIIGLEAKNSKATNTERVVDCIKRELGDRSYSRRIGSIQISPVKISAMILKKLVDDANLSRTFSGKSAIKDVVITVPAYFGSEERELTKQAGEIAGLNVLALLNEPTAAALHFGIKDLDNKTFMIYDLGGGTFDVSIMRMQNGELETLSTDGDHKLGGMDWDEAIVNHVLKMNGINETYQDIKYTRFGGQMILAAETCKKNLSSNDSAPFKGRYKTKTILYTVRRAAFEELTQHLVEKTIQRVRDAIKLSTIPVSKLDLIILVGGSTYMPMIKKRLAKEFPNTSIQLDLREPDLAVAKGAAIHAYNLTHNQFGGLKVKIKKDLHSHSYGLECNHYQNGRLGIQNMILRTDPIQYTGTHHFSTRTECSSISLTIREDLRNDEWVYLSDLRPDEGRILAENVLYLPHKVPKDTPIDLIVTRDSDGIIKVVATCQGKNIIFEVSPKQKFSDQEFNKARKELDNMNL